MAERHEEAADRGRVGLACLPLTGRREVEMEVCEGQARERELVGGDSCYLSPFPPSKGGPCL